MIDFSKVTFIKSAPSIKEAPFDFNKEVIFVGKSNVGKSSLINALTKKKNLAYTSSKPGFTKLLNYYLIDESFYLVDAPGYGYTASGSRYVDNFSKMMEDYFDKPSLKGVIFLIDSRHEMSKDDVDFYHFVMDKNIPFVVVLTKGDKLNQSERAKAIKRVSSLEGVSYVLVSVDNEKSLSTLRGKIAELVN